MEVSAVVALTLAVMRRDRKGSAFALPHTTAPKHAH
jgi:hypothetical protein